MSRAPNVYDDDTEAVDPVMRLKTFDAVVVVEVAAAVDDGGTSATAPATVPASDGEVPAAAERPESVRTSAFRSFSS